MSRRVSVLVTGVGGRSVGHQILHALLLCGDTYHVVAADADPFSYGLYHVDTRYLVPPAAEPSYVPAILRLVERERLAAILPGTEPEVRVLADYAQVLMAAGCRVIGSPAEVVRLCSDKWQLSRWLQVHGFAVPRTVQAFGWSDLVTAVGFPLVGKPARQSGGSRHVAILVNEGEVQRYLEDCERDQIEVVFQEYIDAADQEYTVGVLVSRTGELIDSIVVHRKLLGLSLGPHRVVGGRTYALSTGYSQGFVIRHPVIQQHCEALAAQVGARGPLNVQCRFADGEVKVFEVHPRFSGTTSIRADVGFNEPHTLIRNFLFGEEIGRLSYRTDVAAIRAFQHLIVPLDVMQRTPSALGSTEPQ